MVARVTVVRSAFLHDALNPACRDLIGGKRRF
jgi:hypothetical protein